MEPATLDRIQQLIAQEAAEHFGAEAAPRLVLLHYGDHPAIEPGELYLQVVLSRDDLPWDAWTEAQRDQVWDFLAQRLHEARGLMVTVDTPRQPTGIMRLDGISELAERARGVAPVLAHLGSADLQTLDALITAGIGESRSAAISWALARIRERPAYARLGERARELAELTARF